MAARKSSGRRKYGKAASKRVESAEEGREGSTEARRTEELQRKEAFQPVTGNVR